MKATTYVSRNKVRLAEVPEPQVLNSGDAVVRVTSAAICGSDLHLVDGYVPGMLNGDIIGHEFMGEVVEIGNGVRKLRAGDRVVVAFPISCGRCWSCNQGLFSVCENTNPSAWVAEKVWGFATAGIFGYSHMTGGYAGGQAEYVRVPFADVGALKVPDGVSDEQALFLGDILPTGWMGAEMADVRPGDVVAVWGAGPVGLLTMASARLMGAERIIAIDRFDYRLRMAREKAGATDTIDYEQVSVHETLRELTGGRGVDKSIDAVGMEAHSDDLQWPYDRVKQAMRLQTDRGMALREAILACRNGGVISVIGAYGGFMDKFPIGAVMNRSLTIRAGQCHVQRYMQPLMEKVERGEIDPSFIITHRLSLEDVVHGYDIFKNKLDDCVKVVLKPGEPATTERRIGLI
ncbi:MAG TPA: zinc-dependent alcohol dehydrogenase [Candidatus Limnocylindrales bacterium]|nr:zinc-dependent alcohol dehydrogenase [Candidatus Limnocylindrales bacterium]